MEDVCLVGVESGGEWRVVSQQHESPKVSPIVVSLSLDQPSCLMGLRRQGVNAIPANSQRIVPPRAIILGSCGCRAAFCWLPVEMAVREGGAIKQFFTASFAFLLHASSDSIVPSSSCLSQALFTDSTSMAG
jgi:hypothetical protein